MLGKRGTRKDQNELELAKENLLCATNENIQRTQESIDHISELLNDFKKHNYKKHDSFFNLCIFSDIVTLDLTILLEKIRLVDREQEKKLFARVIAVTIMDFLDNISVLIGRDCLAELKQNNMHEFIDEFKSVHKHFSDFRKANERLLREIRNTTIAHKSKDTLKLNNSIKTLNVDEIYQLGFEIKNYTNVFIDLSTKVIYIIVDYMKEGRRI